jgi:hypothetical protein
VRAQVERVLAHPLFHGSKRYTNLLRYIVDKTLEGRQDELKERVIGIEVFGRAADYDTSFDATVRVAATEVRKRLTLYYGESSHEMELRIEVPVGSYIAEFRLPEQKQLPHDVLPAPRLRRLPHWNIVVPLAVAILALVGWGVQRLLIPASAIDKFWDPLIQSTGPLVICIDAPPIDPLTSAKPSNSNHAAPSGTPPRGLSNPNEQVALTEISAADDLASFLRKKGKDSAVRPARDTSLSDLRLSSIVILGLFDNDWVRKLEGDVRFRIRGDASAGKQWIEDANNPADRKWSMNVLPPSHGEADSDYALISRVQYPSTGQWWIGIAGLTGRGTEVAHLMLIDPKAMAAVSSGFPKDWEHKNMQMVLAIKKAPGSPGTSKVVATYFW